MANPVQIVLNHEHFQQARDTPSGGGPPHDFFAERDPAFAAHKAQLNKQALALATAIEAQAEGPLGYIKVVLRRGAWAKSHRPVNSLLRLDHWRVAGGGSLGEMYFEATPSLLRTLADRVTKAEPETRWREINDSDKVIPNPTRLRSEVGAVERLEAYGPEDRRDFSASEALSWLSQARTGGHYLIDLFEAIPPEEMWDTVSPARRRLFTSFRDGLHALGLGVRTVALLSKAGDAPRFMLRLERSDQPARLPQLTASGARTRRLVPFDRSSTRHEQLLAFLDKHPLVRRVRLPGVLEASARRRRAVQPTRGKPAVLAMPAKDGALNYPVVGIIDGGVTDALGPWLLGRHGLLAEDHMDLNHGSFIGGLIVAGAALNGTEVGHDPDGVNVVDINVLPDTNHPTAFGDYYPDGPTDFFNEVEAAVANARARWNTRIFNFSLNITEPVPSDTYSIYAARLDEIAEAHNVMFVISAGNLAGGEERPEWVSDEAGALATLASSRDDGIFVPAESVRNISVGALNPPDMSSCVSFAPANYTRRGPGLRSGAKPDVACVGGGGTPCNVLEHGLFSIDPTGAIASDCGTSYAAPWTAKCLAHLDSAIEGEVSRETLHALLVHNCDVPDCFESATLKPFARHLVGFGYPASALEMLERGPHEATIVIATRLPPEQQIVLPFAWPPSLTVAPSKCRGLATLTLVTSPPIDRRFGAEFVRINIDASLQQAQPTGGWKGRASPIYLPGTPDGHAYEADLIEHGLKWNPVKRYAMHSPRGSGKTTSWRLLVKYTARTAEKVPDEGIPFTAILTIRDPQNQAPVFDEMRQALTSSGVQIADIRTAVRIKPRI